MSFGGKTDNFANSEPKPLGLRAERLPSQEFGRVVPYFAGYGMTSGVFISEPWGVRSVPVTKKVGKKKQTVGFNYYCSFAMVFCLGPVDRIEEVWLNGELFWTGAVTRGATDYADLTVGQFGRLRIYWGTEAQVEDPDLATSGVVHPAYRGQCYGVFVDWLLGQNKTQCPSVEIRIQRTPAVSWMTPAQNIDDDANPAAVLAEWWASKRFGLGLDEDLLDQGLLNAVADRLVDEGLGVSPFISNSSSFTKALGMLLDHVDGFAVQGADGLFGFDLVRPVTYVPREWTEDDITEPPSVEASSWWETFNAVHVKYLARDRYFETDAVTHRDMASFAITGSTREKTVEREWITSQDVAIRVAAALGRQLALPFTDLRVKVRKDSAAEIEVGTVVRVTYANAGLAGLAMRVMAKSVDKPESGEVTFDLTEDRGYLNAEFYLPDAVTQPAEETYAPGALYAEGVVELPFGWGASDAMRFGMQPVRGDIISNGFNFLWKRAGGSFVDLGASDVFWMAGTTNAAIAATVPLDSGTAFLDVTFGGADKVIDSMTYAEACQSPWVFLFIGDEILIPYEATLVSAGRYAMKALRARFGTVRAAHLSGAAVRVVAVYVDPIAEHALATPTTAAQAYKLQPFFMGAELPLADCPEIAITPRKRGLAPLPPANLKANGDGVAPTYATGTNVALSWDETHELRDQRPPEEVLVPRAQATEIEVLTTGGTVMATINVPGTAGPYTLTNSAIVSALGSETDFVVRARYLNGAVRSLTFAEVTVWKV